MNRKITLLTFLCLSSAAIQLNAQCTSAGPNNPTSAVNNTGIGTTGWGTPTNALTANNVRTISSAIALGDKTNYLFVTGFNFAIPSTAIICGISVTVEKGGSGLFHAVNDHSVRIVKGGNVAGSEHAIDNTWGGPDETVVYGGSGDLWGTTWTPAEINAGNFGVAFSASLTGLSILPAAHIDNIRVTIHFDNSLPVELTNFSGSFNGTTTNLIWETASELNNDFFTVERSSDGISYEQVGTIKGASNSSQHINYQLDDMRPLNGIVYYRLVQTDFNGHKKTFDPITVDCRTYDELTLSPNPAGKQFTVNFKYDETKTYTIAVFNQSGKQVLQYVNLQSGQLVVGDHLLENGLYMVQLRTEDEIISMQKLLITQ